MILVSIYINFTIFLKHPRTQIGYTCTFNVAFFYIIFKHRNCAFALWKSFSTIHFYIILKPDQWFPFPEFRFSTIHFYIILKHNYRSQMNIPVSVPYIFTSFSNRFFSPNRLISFQYHTFLHHSQTLLPILHLCHLFQYHTFLHHSQTSFLLRTVLIRFSTIHFYIILKPMKTEEYSHMRFSTIHFYIILKLIARTSRIIQVSVPYIFTSFSNRDQSIVYTFGVSVPYIFTSFSNVCYQITSLCLRFSTIHFYIILKLGCYIALYCRSFSTIHFYIILKRLLAGDWQGAVSVPYIFTSFSNLSHILRCASTVSVPYIFTSFSNHPRTDNWRERFQYHTFLHHSQTSGGRCSLSYGFSTIHFYIILKPQIQKWTAIICAKQGTQTHLIDFTLISIYNIP